MKRSLACCILALLFTGCASSKGQFNHENRSSFVIGKTSEKEVLQLMGGEPGHVSMAADEKGSRDTMSYFNYESIAFSSFLYRSIELEFRDNLLNGYLYTTTFTEEAINPEFGGLSQITKDTSNRFDVLRVMGEPSGKALCPTGFSSELLIHCSNGTELWMWKANEPKPGHYKQVRITFNRNGIVSGVGVESANH
jgi:hypothetical protein